MCTTRRLALVILAIAAGSIAQAQSPGDPLVALAGTWGQSPVDGQPGLTGSIFTAHKDSGGVTRLDLIFAPSGWSCSVRNQQVTWHEQERRFEWPNQSTRVKARSCWIQLDPRGDALDVRMFCPYSCTKAEDINALQLARMAATRLSAPATVVETFCSSPDPLRHALCTPGAVQDRIAAGDRLADQLRVLDDSLEAKTAEAETELVLLDVLERCHASSKGTGCISDELQARVERLQQRVRARQLALASERESSEALVKPLAGSNPPLGWERPTHLVSDRVIGSLRIADCDKTSCTATLSSETNYTFGASGRQGSCTIEAPVQFTGDNLAFGYVELAESDRHAAGAGRFANFCRIDVARKADGFDVSLRGAGCQEWCSEAHFQPLAGRYQAMEAPSFSCADTDAMPWDERIVCLDPRLAALDRNLAGVFGKARASATGPDAASLAASQRAWLKERRETCDADRRYSCVKELYQRRINELSARAK